MCICKQIMMKSHYSENGSFYINRELGHNTGLSIRKVSFEDVEIRVQSLKTKEISNCQSPFIPRDKTWTKLSLWESNRTNPIYMMTSAFHPQNCEGKRFCCVLPQESHKCRLTCIALFCHPWKMNEDIQKPSTINIFIFYVDFFKALWVFIDTNTQLAPTPPPRVCIYLYNKKSSILKMNYFQAKKYVQYHSSQSEFTWITLLQKRKMPWFKIKVFKQFI